MLSLFFIPIIGLILPGVLARCCIPDKLSTVIHTPGNPNSTRIISDETRQKYLHIPLAAASNVAFEIFDNANKRVYTMRKDGACTYMGLEAPNRLRCIPDSAYLVTPPLFLGLNQSTNINFWHLPNPGDSDDGSQTVFGVDKESCIPAIVYIVKDSIASNFLLFANSTTDIDESELAKDVSACVSYDSVLIG